MQQRISITLDPCEVTALIADARANFRHPREHLRFILCRELERRGLLPAGDVPAEPTEVSHAPAN